MLTSEKSFDLLRDRQRHVRPEGPHLVLAGEIHDVPGSARQDELGQLILGELPLRVIRGAENQSASEVRLAQTAFERQRAARPSCWCPSCRREVPRRPWWPGSRSAFDQSKRSCRRTARRSTCLCRCCRCRRVHTCRLERRTGIPAVTSAPLRCQPRSTGTNQQVSETGVDGLADRERRRFRALIRPGKHCSSRRSSRPGLWPCSHTRESAQRRSLRCCPENSVPGG